METSGLAVNNIRWRLTSFSSHIIFHVILEIIFCSLTSLFISVSRQIYHPLLFSSEGLLPGCNLKSYHIFSCNCNIHFLLFRQLFQMLKWEIYSLHLFFFTGNCPSFVATEVSCNRCFRTNCSYMTSGHSPEAHWSLEARWGPENQQLWSLFSVALGRTWQDP